ncbi:MAG: tripartite tricarboxylate transporter substrate binding protein BugD [Rhodoplanes sp.]|uniref:Bug family tripartite tricarboxylate transporter substrate binding protein n=1 Tax=Rhodoplanes sp. TaxID=1968906 RepID=UPI00181A8D9C|nr:tripartite tricarboxylate transporter substrate-binding protein [Rhodoplanes sp.]NVO13635.1 tripartite tricarboxylate transporter substrate binding protein BugD [Rhodoplanes sp.]
MLKLIAGVCVAALAAVSPALAQSYPVKPITFIVPFAVGGPNDVLARLVSDQMARDLGQSIIIENAPGAGGTTGSARAVRAEPDGHTLLSGNLGSLGAAFALYKKIQYDVDDVRAVGMLAGTPNLVIVRKDFPASTLAEFIAYAKAHPETVTVGNAGFGSNAHLVCLFLENLAGIKLRHVPYRGTGPAMTDLLGGQLDGMCDSTPNVVPQVQAGTVKALVVAQVTRLSAVPEVPSSTEAGLPKFVVVGWNAIVAPAKTPKPVIDKLNAALRAALDDPTMRKRIEDIGAIVPGPAETSPEWMDKFLRSEAKTWGDVIREAGVSVE